MNNKMQLNSLNQENKPIFITINYSLEFVIKYFITK